MTLFLAILFGAMTLFAIYQALKPFLESRDDQLRFELLDRELEQIETLSARKGAILQTLKDIEFDYETGKISEDDYDRLRRRHERKALKVMRKLDDLREGDDDMLADVDDAIAERLESLRGQEPSTDTTATDATERTLVCPECDRRLEPDAKFCDQCGEEIDEETRRTSVSTDSPSTRTDVPSKEPPESDSDDLALDVY